MTVKYVEQLVNAMIVMVPVRDVMIVMVRVNFVKSVGLQVFVVYVRVLNIASSVTVQANSDVIINVIMVFALAVMGQVNNIHRYIKDG